LSIHPGYLVGREERNVATFKIFTPPSSRLHPGSGLSKRTVSGRPRNLLTLAWLTRPDRYFCEPAYEKFRGTNEGALNSRLYNEKAYVLSRGFILRALERAPSSLEDEIKGFYLPSPFSESSETEDAMDEDEDRGEGSSQSRGGGQKRLEKVLNNSKDLISLSQALQQQSQTQPMSLSQSRPPVDQEGPPPVLDEEAAVPSLTAGGILTLQRVLAKLSDIQRNHSQRSFETVPMSS